MLPLLEAALPTLLPLLKKRDTYYVAAIAVLTFCLWGALTRARGDENALAARPRVETKVKTNTKTVTVAGPERVETKTVYVPGTTQIQYVDRVVEIGPATTTVTAEKDYDRSSTPSCPPAPVAPWRYVGVLADPFAPTKLVGVRGGVTLFNRLDLGLGARFSPRAEGQAEVSVRF